MLGTGERRGKGLGRENQHSKQMTEVSRDQNKLTQPFTKHSLILIDHLLQPST